MVVLPLNKRNTGGVSMVLLYFLQHRCGTANITVCFSAPCQRVNYAYPVRVYHHWIGLSGASVTGTSSGDYGRTDGPVVEHHSDGHRGRSRTGTPFDNIASSGCRHIFLGGAHHHYWRKWHWPSPGEAVQPNGNGLFHAAAGRAADYHLLKACLGCPLVRRRLIRVFSWHHFARRCR